MDKVFLKKLNGILEDNSSKEQFGVNELANEIGMSRSQLHRKLNLIFGKSASQYVREYRLQKAMTILQNEVVTASEIAYRVGFNSPTYFNTSFREYFGHTPGEVKYKGSDGSNNSVLDEDSESNPALSHIDTNDKEEEKSSKEKTVVFSSILILLIIAISYYFYTGSTNISPVTKNTINDKSIAVLPSKNLSSDPSDQHFADGVTNAITNHLSSIKEFKVISGTTMEHYRGSRLTAPQIAKELNVSYLLEASTQKYGDSVKIIIQLIDALSDKQIWSEDFEMELKYIFAIQSKIAIQIATELQISLSPNEITQIDKRPTKNMEAYNNFITGKYFSNVKNMDNYKISLEYLKKSIKLDPDFALAYAAMADIHLFWGDSVKLTKELALKTIALDSNNGEAHAILGDLANRVEWDWEKAEKEYQLAIQINPNSPNTNIYYAQFQYDRYGRSDEARKLIDKALYLDPLSYNALMRSAYFYLQEGKYEQAMTETEKGIEIDKISGWSYWLNFENYIQQGKYDMAVDELAKGWKLSSVSDENIELMKAAYNRYGINGVYQWINDFDLNKYGREPSYNGYHFYQTAQKFSFINDKDKTLKWLELAYDNHSILMHRIKHDPYFKNIRTEPRFLAILKKMNLGDYQ